MKIKNISEGPRYLHSSNFGTVIMAPGEERDDIEMTDAELKSAKASDYFEFDGKGPASPASPVEKSGYDLFDVEQLKAHASLHGVDLGNSSAHAGIVKKLEAANVAHDAAHPDGLDGKDADALKAVANERAIDLGDLTEADAMRAKLREKPVA